MMTKDGAANREQIEFLSLDQLVPEDHLVRKLENAIDWSFIYGLVEDKYSVDNGRPSLDPVTLIKLPVLQYMFGIRSMRRTIKEADVNMAYRWFLGAYMTRYRTFRRSARITRAVSKEPTCLSRYFSGFWRNAFRPEWQTRRWSSWIPHM